MWLWLWLVWVWMWVDAWFARRLTNRQGGRARRRSDESVYCRAQAKPAWVTREIVRLKALMPDAGCRTISLVFNRRFAAHANFGRRMTVGKSFVADTIREHSHEIEVVRRRIKHRVPKATPKNLAWGLDLTGKTDSQGKLHMILGCSIMAAGVF